MSKFDAARMNRQMPAFRDMDVGGEIQRLIDGQESSNAEIGELAAAIETLPETVVVPLIANSVSQDSVAKPTARALSRIRARRYGALASDLGTLLLEITNGAGTRLTFSPGIDAKTLTAEFVEVQLTNTTANLSLAPGDPVIVKLTSNNGDATGGPAIVELSYT